MKKIVLLLVAVVLAACSTPSAPVTPEASFDEAPITCRGGYAIANRNGEWVCEPVEGN